MGKSMDCKPWLMSSAGFEERVFRGIFSVGPLKLKCFISMMNRHQNSKTHDKAPETAPDQEIFHELVCFTLVL